MTSPQWIWRTLVLLLMVCALASSRAVSLEPEAAISVGRGLGILEHGDGRDAICDSAVIVINSDGSYENGFAWQYEGVAPPYYGAFAECSDTGAATICGAVFDLTRTADQSGGSMDVYVWDDAGLGPGNVLSMTTGVSPGPISVWPAVSRHTIDIPDVDVSGPIWLGYWGAWPGVEARWYVGADLDGFGGCPRTNIAPGIGFPTGWQDVAVVWGPTQALGIGAMVMDTTPSEIIYRGFLHRPIGNATLDLVDSTLVVSGIGSSGNDGVSIYAIPRDIWRMEIAEPLLVDSSIITYTTYSGDTPTSVVTEAKSEQSDSLTLSMNFAHADPTSPFLVKLIRNGEVVRSRAVYPPPLPLDGGVPRIGDDSRWVLAAIGLVYFILKSISYEHVETRDGEGNITSSSTTKDWDPQLGTVGHIAGDVEQFDFDEVEVTPLTLTGPPLPVTRIDVTASNVSTFAIIDELGSPGFWEPWKTVLKPWGYNSGMFYGPCDYFGSLCCSGEWPIGMLSNSEYAAGYRNAQAKIVASGDLHLVFLHPVAPPDGIIPIPDLFFIGEDASTALGYDSVYVHPGEYAVDFSLYPDFGEVYLQTRLVGGLDPASVDPVVPSRERLRVSPNPSSHTTDIVFTLPRVGPAMLSVHDVTGRRLRQWLWEEPDAAEHRVQWDGTAEDRRPVPAGVLFYRLQAGGETFTQKVVKTR